MSRILLGLVVTVSILALSACYAGTRSLDTKQTVMAEQVGECSASPLRPMLIYNSTICGRCPQGLTLAIYRDETLVAEKLLPGEHVLVSVSSAPFRLRLVASKDGAIFGTQTTVYPACDYMAKTKRFRPGIGVTYDAFVQ